MHISANEIIVHLLLLTSNPIKTARVALDSIAITYLRLGLACEQFADQLHFRVHYNEQRRCEALVDQNPWNVKSCEITDFKHAASRCQNIPWIRRRNFGESNMLKGVVANMIPAEFIILNTVIL